MKAVDSEPESSRVLDVSIVIFFIEKSDIETLFILFSSMNDALCWKKKSVHIFNAFGLVGKKKRKEERRRVLSIFLEEEECRVTWYLLLASRP